MKLSGYVARRNKSRIFNGKKYEYWNSTPLKKDVEKIKRAAYGQGYKSVRVTHNKDGYYFWVYG